MGHANQNNHADPQQTARAQETWSQFAQFMKWGTVATVGIVVLLALITL